MPTKRTTKPKKSAVVHIEFENAADLRQLKVWAANHPQIYGVYLGEGKGWQLPKEQDRFLSALSTLRGRITGPA